MMEHYIDNNPEQLEFLFKTVPWILLIGWAIYSILVVFFRQIRITISNFYIIESIPNVFVTLGLFGTFTGIAYGLLEFNTSPDKIKESIKLLLDGLKLAMFTSITGILLSLIFDKIIKIGINSRSIAMPESAELFELRNLNRNFLDFKNAISTSHYNALVESLKEVLSDFNNVFLGFINELVEQNFQELTETISQLSEWQMQHKEDVEHLTEAYQELVIKHTEFVDKTSEWVNKLDLISGQSSRLQHVIDEFNDAFNEDGNLSRILRDVQKATSEIKEATGKFSAITSNMNDASYKLEETGNKISKWADIVQTVSDNSQLIVEKVEVLQHINGTFDHKLGKTFKTLDALMLEYIKSLEVRINRK